MKKYKIILADPPWMYWLGGTQGAATLHYDVLKTKTICSLKVNELADDNCALFMWVTWPVLPEGLDVMRCWGFRYRTLAFNWIKGNTRDGKPFFGLGQYTRANSEVCLLGIKGSMQRVDNTVSQLLFTPRRAHSQKPDEQYALIERLFGKLPRLELFARQTVEGWDTIDGDYCSSIGERQVYDINWSCNKCGHNVPKMSVTEDSMWVCPQCGAETSWKTEAGL